MGVERHSARQFAPLQLDAAALGAVGARPPTDKLLAMAYRVHPAVDFVQLLAVARLARLQRLSGR